METFSALMAFCAGNSPVPGEFPAQKPVTRSFDVFFDLSLSKPLSKQSWGWRFETLPRPLWHDVTVSEINMVRSGPVPGMKGPGQPKKTWDECVKQDMKVCGRSEAGTQDWVSWRSSEKNSRQEPTPSYGSAPQSMAAPQARRVLGMRTRSFHKTGFDWLVD